MRLLLLGDSAGTGFGTVTADLGRALLAAGHDVKFVSLNEMPGSDVPEPFMGRMLRIGRRDGWLAAVSDSEYQRLTELLASGEGIEPEDRLAMEGYAQAYLVMQSVMSGKADADGWVMDGAIVIGDVGALEVSRIGNFVSGAAPVLHYVPIEGEGLPPRWAQHWRRMRPVAMTRFGAREIATITGAEPPVAYHGVDPDAFWPVSPLRPIKIDIGKGRHLTLNTKAACREFVSEAAFQLSEGRYHPNPDRTWVLRADRHMPRKMYSSAFRIMGTVMSRLPDVEFLTHCRTFDQGGNLDDDRSKWAPQIAARMLATGFHDAPGAQGVNRDALNAIYNAADIYLSTSAEGFGLTIAEAMACGVPVVGLDYSAVPEVIGRDDEAGGVLVPVGGLVDNIYGHFWARPDEAAAVSAVTKLVLSRGMRRDLGAKASERVRTMFRWPDAAATMATLIEQRAEVAA